MGEKKGSLVFLSRGGILIPASAGNIQLGIPPETIKDSMKLRGGVPDTYIVPRDMFDLHYGVALAEMEFPVYYNFFIKKGKTRIICNKDQRKRIEVIISEALFGPEVIDDVNEFAEGEKTPGFPDLKAEMDHFRKTMRPEGSVELEDLMEFCVLDDQGRAAYKGVEIQFDGHDNLRISEKGKEIAFIGRDMPVMVRKSAFSGSRLNFRPPIFGVTTLGAGHGFDPDADTSGLIIWVGRRGIMVDPPVNSTEKLLALGVGPKWIDSVILTHCHADHDAGTLQKILHEGKINLYTTNTIYNSFMKKAAALTGIEEHRLKRLVHFYPVCIGRPMIISGGRFNFNYTLHSIPTISIQASLSGKSMVYSSDTMNDPQYIEQLYAEGVLTKNRRDFLINFPWDRDVIFHEAGIPPIHTPLDYLCNLPAEIRKRMYLVHVDPRTIPCESSLRVAPTGLANTIELDVLPLPYDEAIAMLDTFSRVELFENLAFEKARELLLVAKVEHYKASGVIFSKGDPSDKFYVVMSGVVDIILDGKIITTYDVGGYFGEKGLLLDENRTATATSRTDAKLLTIRKDEMLSLIRGTESEYLLRQIADFQNVKLRETLKNNPIFGSLTATQQTRLHGLIRPFVHSFHPGEVIAGKDSAAGFTFIVGEGSVDVCHGRVLIDTLTKGGLFGVKDIFEGKDKKTFSFVAKEETCLYCIEHADLNRFLDTNPGVYVKMYHILY
jgi:CRP-like cAMP-binding protein